MGGNSLDLFEEAVQGSVVPENEADETPAEDDKDEDSE